MPRLAALFLALALPAAAHADLGVNVYGLSYHFAGGGVLWHATGGDGSTGSTCRR